MDLPLDARGLCSAGSAGPDDFIAAGRGAGARSKAWASCGISAGRVSHWGRTGIAAAHLSTRGIGPEGGEMSWMGQSVRRVEDDRLLRGQAKFVADVKLPGTLEAVFLRSVHAHAAIARIDATAARAVPGVAAVITAQDIAGRTAPLSVAGEAHTPERLLKLLKPLDRVHPSPLLPEKKVTYVGQPVVLVVAETLDIAVQAAESLEIEYEPLPAVIDPVAALAEGAPLVEPAWGSNLALSVG